MVIVVLTALCALCSVSFAFGSLPHVGSAPQVATPANSIEQLLQAAFVAKNPKVTRAKILELRSTGSGAGPYVLLGWGIRPDFKFEGSLEDELFGVFVLNNNLTKIEQTLDIFPTCRWADCVVSIERVADAEIVIVGAGSSGDEPFRRVYKMSGAR